MGSSGVEQQSGPVDVLWRPPGERVAASRLSAFAAHVRERYGVPTASYEQLWQWSVDSLEDFWAAVWEHFEVLASTPYDRVLTSHEMPGACWFPGARLNLAENLLRADRPGPALIAVSEQGPARWCRGRSCGSWSAPSRQRWPSSACGRATGSWPTCRTGWKRSWQCWPALPGPGEGVGLSDGGAAGVRPG
jgi:hypothetical protein